METSIVQSPTSETDTANTKLQPGEVWSIHDTSGERVVEDIEQIKYFRCTKELDVLINQPGEG